MEKNMFKKKEESHNIVGHYTIPTKSVAQKTAAQAGLYTHHQDTIT